MRLGIGIAMLLLTVVGGACSALEVDEADLRGAVFQTDQTHYEAVFRTDWRPRITFAIPTSFTNEMDTDVYLLGCKVPSPPELIRQEGGDWVIAYAPVVQLCLSPPWRLQPGETFRDTLWVEGFLPGYNAAPTFNTEVDGTYRLVRRVYLDPDGKTVLPAALRTSNTFQVTLR